ncbi:uncharacterized protein LOC115093754 [Rhinatrema bivittatum]|uniref:uncharacterized protein LOC115093754 n=1 Tax=Rhinatrema bivittatum TaxID=194408 RepID=UPI00112BA05B|nr:uncharacterized protein LOC115093754 [Rhinatrema bivittatum]
MVCEAEVQRRSEGRFEIKAVATDGAADRRSVRHRRWRSTEGGRKAGLDDGHRHEGWLEHAGATGGGSGDRARGEAAKSRIWGSMEGKNVGGGSAAEVSGTAKKRRHASMSSDKDSSSSDSTSSESSGSRRGRRVGMGPAQDMGHPALASLTELWEGVPGRIQRRIKKLERGWRGGLKCAWIMGHSFIHRAQRRAMKRPYGEHLELDPLGWSVAWFSRRGMEWDEFLQFVVQRIDLLGVPDMLLVHLGGNDVGKKTCRHLLTCIKKDLAQVWIRWPTVRLGWSDIIVRLKNAEEQVWKSGVKNLNKQMGRWMGWEGGFWIRHVWAWSGEAGFFCGDGVHLSDIGMDLFNHTIQEGLEKEIGSRE